jgi:hypothetical protein
MSSWVERYIQMSPPEGELRVERVPVEGATCPECGGGDVRRYPVSAYVGARIAVKCQDCLHTLSLTRPAAEDNWPAFRSVTYDWEASPSERAARALLEDGRL